MQSQDPHLFQEVHLVAEEGSQGRAEKEAIRTLLVCTDDALVERMRAVFPKHHVVVVPRESFVAQHYTGLRDAGFDLAQRADGETVLRKTMPVWDMPYAREHIVDGAHVFDSDAAVIEVTMQGMVTLVIGGGDDPYAGPPVDANTPEGLGVLVDANLVEPRHPSKPPMLSLTDGWTERMALRMNEPPSPFPPPRKKFPRAR